MKINLSHFNVSIPLRPADDSHLNSYYLSWRQRKLIVRAADQRTADSLPPLPNLSSLIQCLQRSPIQLVLLDPDLGTDRLSLWAEACHQARKPAYLEIPSSRDLPQRKHPRRWLLKRGLDWLATTLLLALLSPLLLVIVVALYIDSPGPVLVRRWQVSQRGKLFLCYYFRTQLLNSDSPKTDLREDRLSLSDRSTDFGQLLCRYRLHKLPQLIHVLRGEISLIGPRAYRLEDVAQIHPAFRSQLNALPGMIGAYPVMVQSNFSDVMVVNPNALNYLESWSLLCDLKALFSSIPRVFLAG